MRVLDPCSVHSEGAVSRPAPMANQSPQCGFCGKNDYFAGLQWRSYVSKKRNAPDGAMCAECKVLHAPFRAKMCWTDFKHYAKTPDGTKDIKEVIGNRKGSTIDFPT